MAESKKKFQILLAVPTKDQNTQALPIAQDNRIAQSALNCTDLDEIPKHGVQFDDILIRVGIENRELKRLGKTNLVKPQVVIYLPTVTLNYVTIKVVAL